MGVSKITLLATLATLILAGAGCTTPPASQPGAPGDPALPKTESDRIQTGNEGTLDDQKADQALMAKDDAANKVMIKEKEAGGMIGKGGYEDFAPEKLSWAKDGKVVLFFKASWCPTCRALDADITAHLGEIPNKFYIFKLDYDNSTELKKKYGITYQHTFVQVNEKGEMLKKWSGSPTLADLVAQVQ